MADGEKIGLGDVLRVVNAAPEILTLVNDISNSRKASSDGGATVTEAEVRKWFDDFQAIVDKVLPK